MNEKQGGHERTIPVRTPSEWQAAYERSPSKTEKEWRDMLLSINGIDPEAHVVDLTPEQCATLSELLGYDR